MNKLLLGSVVLAMLSGCGALSGTADEEGSAQAVCDEQSEWAQSGKVDNGNITITCPGNARPTY